MPRFRAERPELMASFRSAIAAGQFPLYRPLSRLRGRVGAGGPAKATHLAEANSPPPPAPRRARTPPPPGGGQSGSLEKTHRRAHHNNLEGKNFSICTPT